MEAIGTRIEKSASRAVTKWWVEKTKEWVGEATTILQNEQAALTKNMEQLLESAATVQSVEDSIAALCADDDPEVKEEFEAQLRTLQEQMSAREKAKTEGETKVSLLGLIQSASRRLLEKAAVKVTIVEKEVQDAETTRERYESARERSWMGARRLVLTLSPEEERVAKRLKIILGKVSAAVRSFDTNADAPRPPELSDAEASERLEKMAVAALKPV